MSAREMTRRFAAGNLSPVEVLDAALVQLAKVEPTLNATCLLDEACGRRMAQASADRWRRGEPLGALDGVPVAVKDTAHVIGWPTRIGSLATPTAPSTIDTPGVARLREAGAVFFCKTNTPEFGWKGITHGPLTGTTRNPWDPTRTTGGSSGGSAALVAAGVVPLATGGDGGGSIRIPAAFSGVFGLKPSYGLVPNFTGSLGPLAVYGGLSRDAADTALLLRILSNPDARDPFAVPHRDIDYLTGLQDGVAGLRLAWSPDLGFPIVDPAVATGVVGAVEALSKAGALVETVTLDLSGARRAFDVIWGAGFLGMLRHLTDAQRAALDPALLQVIVAAQDITGSELQAAHDEVRVLSAKMQLFHQQFDLLLTPSQPLTAFAAGQDTPDAQRFPDWFDWTPFTWPFNLTRQPAASVPCGFVDGLPIGLQIVGPMFGERLILRACQVVETAFATSARPAMA
ncbi:amidase [Acidisphaera sp. L21]|uniref:amidase n=1 Tax=Acidisphaera sp. L21 TaxID=1641851 RepID=UPI00131B76C2|nr:amidase [Acidisphaera sp. L21]